MHPISQIPLKDKKFHNILLWMPNWVGDVILALPTVQALHGKFPNARITAVVKTPSDELLTGHPMIDAVIKIPSGKEGILNSIQFARNLRDYKFDLGIVISNSFRRAAMLFLTGAETRLGYNTEGRGFLLTHPVKATEASKTEYRVDYFFKILSPLGLSGLEPQVEFSIDKATIDSLEEHFTRMGIDAGGFSVAIHPGGSKAPRRWHAERYGILCQKLIKDFGAKIILLGGGGDSKAVEQIMNFCPPDKAFSLLGLNLKEIAAAIKRSKLFIGNDSGMMHLAALVGTPLVGIFGPGNPAATGPFTSPDKQVIVTKNYPCSPCRQKFFKECTPSPHNKPYCIEDISVKDVVGVLDKVVDATRMP